MCFVLLDFNGHLLAFAGNGRLLRFKHNGGFISNTPQQDRFKGSPLEPAAAFRTSRPGRFMILKGKHLIKVVV